MCRLGRQWSVVRANHSQRAIRDTEPIRWLRSERSTRLYRKDSVENGNTSAGATHEKRRLLVKCCGGWHIGYVSYFSVIFIRSERRSAWANSAKFQKYKELCGNPRSSDGERRRVGFSNEWLWRRRAFEKPPRNVRFKTWRRVERTTMFYSCRLVVRDALKI